MHSRRALYAALWIVGLTIGWFEASIVIDLRALLYPNGFVFPLAIMPTQLMAVEITREACSLILLGTIGWIAGTRRADRWGAFLLLFGVWDLMYYVVLKLVLDWPAGIDLTTWDILFLIPVPWAGPIWAPAIVAAEFVAIGTYLVFTPDRARAYRSIDTLVLTASAVIIVATFMTEWRAVAESRLPTFFPVAVFGAAVAIGTAWFVMAERRTSAR